MSWTEEIKKDFATSPTSDVEIRCLEIFCNEDPLNEKFYICNDRDSHVVTLADSTTQEFQKANFELSLTPSTGESVSELSLSIGDVTGEVRTYARRVQELGVIRVKLHVYLLSNLTKPQLNPPQPFTVSEVEINAFQVNAKMSIYAMADEVLQNLMYDSNEYANLS